jgi:hypothetical protein
MKLLREPLFHFVALGAVLFLVYATASEVFSVDARLRIEITASDVELLAETWRRRWQRPPTEQELRGLVDARVREEVLYREALNVGLDENDVVVRRRMVQKMELLSQDLALLADPTDQELRAFFQEQQEEHRIPPRLSFSHVYFNMDQRGSAGEEDAQRVLADIVSETPTPRSAPQRGDRFMLEHDYTLRSPEEVRRDFGNRFAEALFRLEPGWNGPIVSGFGLHLVYVGERVASRIPEYEEIRESLVRDYNRMRSDRAKEMLYEGLSERYSIAIDEDAVRRTALTQPQER